MEDKTEITVKLDVTVTDKDIDDLMACALEGGITYWANAAEVVGDYLGNYSSEQISRGGKLNIVLDEPFERHAGTVYELDKERFLNGLRKYLADPMRPYNILEWDDRENEYVLDASEADAVVCDMIIQYALFDEIVFA